MADKHKHVDEISGVETTGHEWDGIRELNNPMPRWWVYTFYATIIWSIGYAIAYPSIPLVREATKGVLGYSSRAEVSVELANAKAAQAGQLERIASSSLEEIIADPQLQQFAVAGRCLRLQGELCAMPWLGRCRCTGFPEPQRRRLAVGRQSRRRSTRRSRMASVHAGDEETRVSEMPAFGDMLTPDEMRQIAAYVVSLTGDTVGARLVEQGKQLFADNCASCHGEDAKGNRDLGAPNLADAIWLTGEGEQAVINQMPRLRSMASCRRGCRVSATNTVKQLAVFVHSLGGGE